MHSQSLDEWRHSHVFHHDTDHGERRTLYVVVLTATMMVVELIAGTLYGSMALTADGWHMGTHVAALSISLFAYRYARRHADNPYFSFGTGKVGSLGGFASAVALAVVALLMAIESIQRLVTPEAIRFDEAMGVAGVGLAVNLVSAWLLHGGSTHGHHDHAHSGHAHTHDHNLRAAYLHVLADALTSVLAIVALAAGKALGWIWMDALMGLVGAAVITRWSVGLLSDTGGILLDARPGQRLSEAIRQRIETGGSQRIVDLHVWQLAPERHAAIVAVVTHGDEDAAFYKDRLESLDSLVHVTVEVNRCG